jgi:NifB/MoaA-like Fe-S oxidoreductase
MHGTVMTGTLFAPVLKKRLESLNARFPLQLHTVAVENNYFGGDVSVAGLLTGTDLLAARDRVRGSFVIIPGSMLKSGEEVMLDGLTLEEVRSRFGLPVRALDFQSFARFLSSS